MGKRRLAAVLAGVLVVVTGLAGCDLGTPSALTPDQAVKVSGRLVGADGKPVGLTRVALYRRPSVGEAFGNLFVITASVGLACLADEPPALCRGARRVTSAADGTFAFDMKGSDTYEGSGHDAATFDLSAALPASGASLTGPETTVAFRVQVADLRLPDIQFWQPSVSYRPAGNSATLTWTPTPAALGDAPFYEAEFEDRDGNLVWAYPAIHFPATLNTRYLEDFSGGVALRARTHVVGPGTTFDFGYRSHSVAFAGTAGQPLSRRHACFVDDTAGVMHRQGPPCTLTDGDLAKVFSLPTPTCPTPAATPCPSLGGGAPYIDLGARLAVDTVVIRGCTATCTVEVSGDRVAWRPVGESRAVAPAGTGSGEVAMQLAEPASSSRLTPAAVEARYVRVRLELRDTSRLTEISVWGPPGQALPQPTEPVVAAASTARGGHAVGSSDTGGTLRLLVLVNVVGLLVILAVVVWLLRRRGGRRPPTAPAG